MLREQPQLILKKKNNFKSDVFNNDDVIMTSEFVARTTIV